MVTNTKEISYPSTSLYVGDLDEDCTEAMLFERFSGAGSISSIRVCRDVVTKKSLGYAYVNYHDAESAEKALDTLNFEVIKDRPIRIMWSQRNPNLRKSGVGNIFIKNLEKNIDNKAVYDTFSVFGRILSCKVATDENGNSRGYGFVHFQSEEAANNAIEKMNGMLLNGKKVYVGEFVPREKREKQFGISENGYNNLYVKNFQDQLDDDSLRAMFEEFGEIMSVFVAKFDDGRPKGFGFVCFQNADDAQNATDTLNGTLVNGNKIYVGRAMKKSERAAEVKKQLENSNSSKESRKPEGINLYVKNIDDTIDDDALQKRFETFGKVNNAKIMRTENGHSKGFGFVCFYNEDDARAAVENMNGELFGNKPLYVALAQRRDERRSQLRTQFMNRAAQPPLQPMAPIMPNDRHVYSPEPSSAEESNSYIHSQKLNQSMENYPGSMPANNINSSPRWNNPPPNLKANMPQVPFQMLPGFRNGPSAGGYIKTSIMSGQKPMGVHTPQHLYQHKFGSPRSMMPSMNQAMYPMQHYSQGHPQQAHSITTSTSSSTYPLVHPPPHSTASDFAGLHLNAAMPFNQLLNKADQSHDNMFGTSFPSYPPPATTPSSSAETVSIGPSSAYKYTSHGFTTVGKQQSDITTAPNAAQNPSMIYNKLEPLSMKINDDSRYDRIFYPLKPHFSVDSDMAWQQVALDGVDNDSKDCRPMIEDQRTLLSKAEEAKLSHPMNSLTMKFQQMKAC